MVDFIPSCFVTRFSETKPGENEPSQSLGDFRNYGLQPDSATVGMVHFRWMKIQESDSSPDLLQMVLVKEGMFFVCQRVV